MSSRKCKCSDGSYSVRCCNSRGVGPSSVFASAYTPPFSTLGLTHAKMLDTSGKTIVNYGTLKQAQALVASHPIEGKIWTQYTKKEIVEQKAKTGNTPLSEKPSAYDARPAKFSPAQRRHWERRPLTGIYSKAPVGNVRLHRAQKFATATTVKGIGHSMRFLGYFTYGYVAYQTAKDPTGIPMFLLQMSPQYALMTQRQQQHADAVTQMGITAYLESWFRGHD